MIESNFVQNLRNLENLPLSWIIKDFKDIVSDKSGGNKKLAKSDFLEVGEIAIVDQGKELIGGYYNDLNLAVKSPPPYIVFGDHTRIFKYIDFPFVMGADGIKVLKSKLIDCHIKYLYYFFLSIDVPNTGYNRHYKYLKELKIPLPPLETQKKIAAILDEADKLRQLDKQLIEKYDALTQSLFLDMFGDPIANPKGWSKKPMSNLMKIVRGGSPRPIDKFLGGTYPWIKIGDATKGNDIYLESTKEHITEEGLKKTRLLPKGSLIFANCGVSLGFVRILTFEGCIHDGWLAFSEIDSKKLNEVFLLKALNSITRYFRETAPDGTQPNLNIGIMSKFKIILPPVELQNKFEQSLFQIEAQKELAQQSLEKSEELFNSLLQKAFKGELV